MQNKILNRISSLIATVLIVGGASIAQQPTTRPQSQPQAVTRKLPPYPPIARAACAQGSVAVLVDIELNGNVTATDVLYGHTLLRGTAEATARNWTFDVNKKEAGQRREVIRFSFQILPFEVSEKKLKPVWVTATDVEIRVHPLEPSCDHCDENRLRQLRRGGCPPQP